MMDERETGRLWYLALLVLVMTAATTQIAVNAGYTVFESLMFGLSIGVFLCVAAARGDAGWKWREK